jgi:hypothetical protein
MKAIFFLLLIFSVCSSQLFASDAYAEYTMTGMTGKVHYSKLYIKDGDRRTESETKVGDKTIMSFTLNLKSNPGVTMVFSPQSKTYNEIKNAGSDANDLTISVLGNEKIGIYNCHHVRMTSKNRSWEIWVTKDLPSFDFSLENNDEALNSKIKELLKNNNVSGVPVKMAFLKPGTSEVTMTMELTKYEAKDLDASLFKIPDGYTKSTIQFDPEKMKTMTDEEKKEMIKKMMIENMNKE